MGMGGTVDLPISTFGGSATLTVEQLNGLTLHAGAETACPYSLDVIAAATVTGLRTCALATTTIDVTVTEQADAPNLSAPMTLSVNEGGTVALNISASAFESDQNDPSITITGLGDATLSYQADDGSGIGGTLDLPVGTSAGPPT